MLVCHNRSMSIWLLTLQGNVNIMFMMFIVVIVDNSVSAFIGSEGQREGKKGVKLCF